MSSSLPGAGWQRRRISGSVASVIAALGGSSRSRPPLAPQVRGHVDPRVVEHLERRGWHVHRIGAAAYVHADGGLHLLFGVWPRRSPRPGWAARLGAASTAYWRRLERVAREQRWRRQARTDTGQFSSVMPWTHWPTPALYSWDPAGPSVADQVDALERVSRWRNGLADVSESELRLLDGNR